MSAHANEHIPFNRPYTTGRELGGIADAISRGQISPDGVAGERCRLLLQEMLGCREALVVHSCTAALELSALLLDVGPGDEVIMPSYTFVTTATAFALRGATPVFVDIRPDTLNLDESLVEDAVTARTKAIMAVHYAGVPCEMDALDDVAERHGLSVIEDAAQALLSTYKGRQAGALGDAAALSFHETKNWHCGEGGALLVRRPDWVDRSLILRDKGTNRIRFLRGEVDKYSWVDIGSSYGLGELSAAFLWGQLERADDVLADRRRAWAAYHERFAPLEERGLLRRPVVPEHVEHNAHLYYILVDGIEERTRVIEELDRHGVHAVFHYVPLHSAPAGQRYGRVVGTLPETERASDGLIRLPLWYAMPDDAVEQVIAVVADAVAT